MKSRDLQKEEWADYFDALSRTHRGTTGSIATVGKDDRIRSIAANLPFMGITCESSSEIELLLGGPGEPNVTHTIRGPRRVRVSEGDDPLSAVIEIEGADDETTWIYVGRAAQPLTPGFARADQILATPRMAN